MISKCSFVSRSALVMCITKKKVTFMKRLTLYAMFWMVLIARSAICTLILMCVCKLLFFSFLPDHFTESTLQINTIGSNIYAFGCSLNVRQKERSRSRSVVDKLFVCRIVLCCFIYIFSPLFYSSACSVFTGISNPAVLALKQLWKFALFMD